MCMSPHPELPRLQTAFSHCALEHQPYLLYVMHFVGKSGFLLVFLSSSLIVLSDPHAWQFCVGENSTGHLVDFHHLSVKLVKDTPPVRIQRLGLKRDDSPEKLEVR